MINNKLPSVPVTATLSEDALKEHGFVSQFEHADVSDASSLRSTVVLLLFVEHCQ
jgi:hypothetical protein